MPLISGPPKDGPLSALPPLKGNLGAAADRNMGTRSISATMPRALVPHRLPSMDEAPPRQLVSPPPLSQQQPLLPPIGADKGTVSGSHDASCDHMIYLTGKGASNGKGLDKIGTLPPGAFPPIGRPSAGALPSLPRPGGAVGSPPSGLPSLSRPAPLPRIGELSWKVVLFITLL